MLITLLPNEALQIAINRAGSQKEFAIALSVSQATVSNWLRVSKRLPAELVLQVEDFYGVSRHDLRPDIYPVDHVVDANEKIANGRFLARDQQAGIAA
jgi:DNA-binding transcriptional regulator YdaS (Cro superfamily)